MREVHVVVKDDLDHDLGAEVTRRVGLDGLWWEVDLTAAHSAELDAALKAYVTVGRLLKGGKPISTDLRVDAPAPHMTAPSRRAASQSRPVSAAEPIDHAARRWRNRVNEWGRTTGHPHARVNNGGRMAWRLYADYIAATGDHAPAGVTVPTPPAEEKRPAGRLAPPAEPQTAAEPAAPPVPELDQAARRKIWLAWARRVREWAKAEQHELADCHAIRAGQIPAQLRDDYVAAHPDDVMPDRARNRQSRASKVST